MTTYGAKDIADSFRTVRKNTIQVAQDIPEDQYGFRAAEGGMTVAEMLAAARKADLTGGEGAGAAKSAPADDEAAVPVAPSVAPAAKPAAPAAKTSAPGANP